MKISKIVYGLFFTSVVVFAWIISSQASSFSKITEDGIFTHKMLNGTIDKIEVAVNKDTDGLTKVKIDSDDERGKIVDAIVSSINNFNDYKVGNKVFYFLL